MVIRQFICHFVFVHYLNGVLRIFVRKKRDIGAIGTDEP
jgi:hypothetical protein